MTIAIGFAAAAEWRTLRPVTARGAVLSLGLYLPWGFFQEYLLNGYLLNRLESVLSPAKAASLAAILFSLAHIPNWFLMIAMLAGRLLRRHCLSPL